MNILISAKSGEQENYTLSQDANSKSDTYDVIASKYRNDLIEKIDVKYDDIETPTLDRGNVAEPGSFVTITTLEELKAELGKYTG